MKQQLTCLSPVLAVLLAATAHAQFAETEPNNNKAAANVVSCMNSGDTITGTTTGASTVTAGAASADNFRVRTCALPLGVYSHRLAITTTGAVGHVGSIRGLTQTAFVINTTTDTVFQSSPTSGANIRTNRWFGFGKQEEIFYRVTGTASTTGPYTSTLTTTPVAPTVVPGSFNVGSITVDCASQTTEDTELWIYDGSLNPVVGSDEPPPLGLITGRPATSTVTLGPGTYYVAVSNWNTANNLALTPGTDDANGDPVLDFPDAIANSSTTVLVVNCSFTVSDGANTAIVNVSRSTEYDILWAQFTVGTPPAFNAFCTNGSLGTDHTTACPCGNTGAPGNGCGHSFDANGANLEATGTPSLDDVVLHSQFEPGTSFTLFLQHSTSGDAVFHDGVLCAGGTLIRLRGRAAVGGEAFFPNSLFPNDATLTLSQRGGTFPGSGQTMRYSAWFRNASTTFCPPATANISNGWVIDW